VYSQANLTELKSFGSPPGAVTNVTAAVMVLLAPNGKIPKDRSWKAAKVKPPPTAVWMKNSGNALLLLVVFCHTTKAGGI
jgi:hypothetical protein